MKTILLLLSLIFSLSVCNGQVSKLITNLAPGDLINKMTSEELNTVTFLSISGTMDARDFKTMRDKMAKLEEVELTNATITEYKGLQGTSTVIGEPVQDITYPANIVPIEAFSRNNSIKQVTLPSSVTSIGYKAFNECYNLVFVNIPSSVSSVQAAAFYGCISLRGVEIPASVTEIEIMAFTKIDGIITVNVQNPRYSAIDGVLLSKDQTLLISCPLSKSGTYRIPDSVKMIDNYAFLGCKFLTSVAIPASVTSIGDLAFSECSSLFSISIPRTVTTIGIRTFMYCSSLTMVDLPTTLTTIQLGAFAYCENLAAFNIPSSVTTMGENVFQNCTNLKTIYANPLIPVVLTSDFFRWVDKNTCILYVRKESVDLYKTAPVWKDFLHIEGVLTSIDQQKDADVMVFPNPAKDVIAIHADKGIVSIYNIQGKLAMIHLLQIDKKVNISSLVPGIYVVVVNGERLKLVKE